MLLFGGMGDVAVAALLPAVLEPPRASQTSLAS
jgi:hypothetical protein